MTKNLCTCILIGEIQRRSEQYQIWISLDNIAKPIVKFNYRNHDLKAMLTTGKKVKRNLALTQEVKYAKRKIADHIRGYPGHWGASAAQDCFKAASDGRP